jgi:hypothetical protein
MDVVLAGKIPEAATVLIERYNRTLNKIEAQIGGQPLACFTTTGR